MKWLKPVADTHGVMVSDVGVGCRVSECHGASIDGLQGARLEWGYNIDEGHNWHCLSQHLF